MNMRFIAREDRDLIYRVRGNLLPANSHGTILLIEADPALRRMMTLGLQHQGLRVIESYALPDPLPIAPQQLDLLILDIDRGITSDYSLLEKIQTNAHLASLPTIVLAWDTSDDLRDGRAEAGPSFWVGLKPVPIGDLNDLQKLSSSPMILINKPFDARMLHQSVERLLAVRARQKAAIEALAEAKILTLYDQHAAPSMWPMLTAAGLLLMVIGLLLHIAVTISGFLLALLALLLWTLGTKPEMIVSHNKGVLSASVSVPNHVSYP